MEGLVDIFIGKLFGTVWGWLTTFTLGVIPTWVWVVVVVGAAAWVWKQFGWQGLVGLGLLVLTFGAYRQGWRDAKAGAKPALDLPIETPAQGREAKPTPRPRRRRYNDVTNTWEDVG